MSWLQPFAPVGERPVLVCLPQAGSGCGVFRSWQEELTDVSVVGVRLPGRENRFADPPPESFAAAVSGIVTAIVALVPSGRPIVLFGHGIGGLLGYEVARALPVTHPPAAVVVAGSRPPHLSGREVLDQDAGLAASYVDPDGAWTPCPLHAWGGADDDVAAADAEGWQRYSATFQARQFAGGHDFWLADAEVFAALRAVFSLSRQGV